MIFFLKRFSHEEDGVVAVIIALMLFVFLGFAAAAIDMSYANATRTKLQVTASAAALAGTLEINDANDDGVDDTDDYRRGAVEYAYRNMAAADHGSILDAACGVYAHAASESRSEDRGGAAARRLSDAPCPRPVR